MATQDGGIRRLAVRGAAFTILAGSTGLAIQIVATVVLARLLTPQDFGVFAMVTTFSFLLINCGLNGFTEAVVQCRSISHDLASTLFWINLGCGVLLTVGFAAAGSLLAWFYKDPDVRLATAGIALTIVLTSASVLHLALLKRAMRFSDISFNDIRARILSVATAIVMGLAGYGYWALVGGAVALTLSTTLGAWWMCRWLPGLPKRAPGLRAALRFAFHTYGRFSVSYASRNTDNLLVGWRFSAQALGFYKKAYDLFALSATQLVSAISVVVVGALSRVQGDRETYRRQLLSAMGVVALLGMALGADLTLVGKDVIRILLGPRWAPAGRIFTFFGPGIGVMILYAMHGWIHLSIGHPERWFRWGLVEFVVTVSLFVLALPHGPAGVAIAWTVSYWILTIPAFWYAGQPIGLSVASVLGAIWRYLAASVGAGLATARIAAAFPALAALPGIPGAVVRLLLSSAILLVLYLGLVVLLHGGLAPLHQIVRLMRDMVERPPATDPGVGRHAAKPAPVASEMAEQFAE